MKLDVIVIGAGAVGLFCAAEAARLGRRVLLIDHAKAPGEKIRISGGGRCNFTNLDISPEKFLSKNQRFAISALSRFTQWDFISRVDAAGIAWHEKTLGQLFCDGSSKQIIDMLVDELRRAGGQLTLNTTAERIEQTGNGFSLRINGEAAICESLVIATGGKSIPKMGASGFGYQVARDFGLPIVETRPALVPLTFGERDLADMRELSGVSVEAAVTCGTTRFEEGLLFTHRGLSGPSVLQISSYWREGDEIRIDLAAGRNTQEELSATRQSLGRQSLKNALCMVLPERLSGQVVTRSGLTGNLADQNNAKLTQLHDAVHDWRVRPIGSEGYRTAEVTLGGVDTDALDGKTMEVKTVPNLYFIGEVVDVTGWLGGYNFQWAWSSGWAAGQVC